MASPKVQRVPRRLLGPKRSCVGCPPSLWGGCLWNASTGGRPKAQVESPPPPNKGGKGGRVVGGGELGRTGSTTIHARYTPKSATQHPGCTFVRERRVHVRHPWHGVQDAKRGDRAGRAASPAEGPLRAPRRRRSLMALLAPCRSPPRAATACTHPAEDLSQTAPGMGTGARRARAQEGHDAGRSGRHKVAPGRGPQASRTPRPPAGQGGRKGPDGAPRPPQDSQDQAGPTQPHKRHNARSAKSTKGSP